MPGPDIPKGPRSLPDGVRAMLENALVPGDQGAAGIGGLRNDEPVERIARPGLPFGFRHDGMKGLRA